MPDLNVLLDKLRNVTMLSVSPPSPRNLAVDNHGYLVTISYAGNTILRYSPLDLAPVDQITLTQSNALSITVHGNAYYIGTDTSNIAVVDSNTLSTVNVISDSSISGVRDVIFLRDGEMMVVSSIYNQKLVFFNRSSMSPINYTFAYQITPSYPLPRGLWYVNDSFLYATSWTGNSVYSHATTDGVTWIETLFTNVNTVVSGDGAADVTVDECGRKWVSRNAGTMIIYDRSGTYVGNLTLSLVGIIDVMFMDNYVMYLSDYPGGKIVRLDPHVTC